MKDNFSNQAKEYAQFRPTYPERLFTFILNHVRQREKAWDCGTGNGQIAVRLAQTFTTVCATDISRNQIAQAKQRSNIIYQIAPAEDPGFDDNQFDLVTVGQAIHWFDMDRFYAQVRQTLKPQGIIALIGYGLMKIDSWVDPALHHLYANILGNYWDPERQYIDDNYQTLPFPFSEIETPDFCSTFTWTRPQFIGYLKTWSAVQHYIRTNGEDPVNQIMPELREIWPTHQPKEITLPIFLRLGAHDK